VVSSLPDPSDVPISPELATERNAVRRLEAQMAAEYGADTPAYWRAMSDRLHEYLASPRFAGGPPKDEATRKAYDWLLRVTSAYRALASINVGS
jgi:hypothetical protein